MLNDVDKEFDLPTEDENGEPIEENLDNDVYQEEEEEVEHDDEFYEANELKSTDEQEIDTTAESEEQFNEASEQLKEIYTDVLASGFITEEQLTEIEVLNAQVNEAYDDILGKEKTDIEKLKNRVEELKEGFVGANPDEILNILTENGTKCWLYKDDDDNVLIDGTSIPELTVLVNKFKMIATDGENEGEFKLNPDFIQMVVKDTGTGDAVKSIDNMYYLSTSKYELIGGTWLNDLPTSEEQQGKFLWIKRVTTYMDESKHPTETQPICVSAQDGENGADGVDGKDGVSLVYKGEFASHPSNPQNGWYYRNTIERKTFVYQSGAWYQMTIDGQDGQNGNDGKDGLSIEYKGTMSNPPSNPRKNWSYKDSDNGIVYIYTGIAWEVLTYDGNNGTDGTDGTDGLSVFCTYHDSSTQPATPTANGTTNGWHTNWTSSVIWVSQKVSSSATTGTWGAPIKIQGSDGVSAEEIIIQYAKNQSTTIAPTTGWGTSMPSYQEGYYLWYRTRTKWSNSSNYQYSTPICDSSWKAAQEAYAQIKQLKDKISLIVVDGSTQSNLTLTPGAISAIAKDINLKATNITLEGLVTANSNFKILSNGSIEAKNGKFTGSITGSTITGSNIKGGTLTIGDTSEGNFFKIHSDGSFQAGSVDQWNYKATITYGNSGFYVRAWDDANSKERTTTIDGDGVTVGTTVYSDKYISANGETLNIIDHLKVDGNVAIDGYFRMQNSSSALQARDTSGTLRSLAYISASDNSYFGKGLYDAGIGGTIICGNKVTLRSKNEILLQCGGTTSATNTHTIEFISIDGNGFFRSTVTNATRLGSLNYLWNIVYSKNGINQSSDRNLKENIRYVDEHLPNKLAKTISEESDLTSQDLYNFVKDDLFLAKYNFIGEEEENIGFIAQDLLYNLDSTENKIGQIIVSAKDSARAKAPLSYNVGNYVNVLAGALKQAILKIEKLEELINGKN